MINKRLMKEVPESKRYIGRQVLCQWIMLLCNIVMVLTWSQFFNQLYQGTTEKNSLWKVTMIAVICILIRFYFSKKAVKMGFLAGKEVKQLLREKIYRKLLRLGTSYQEKVATSEVVQVAVEGVEQLETYFGSYLPQFFYSMLAPITLFIVLSFVSIKAAIVLLICVPLIPISIMCVQKFAKKLLAKYWGQYTSLGDSFLENLQGMTTLKIYQADERKQEEMNKEAELFRKVTMRVLTMQLNSITIMDLVAFGGAGIGAILAVMELRAGHIGIGGALSIILLSAEFFIPMRLLGSFFHIAMNGMAASDKIFKFLECEEGKEKTEQLGKDLTIGLHQLQFGYEKDRRILDGVSEEFVAGKFYAFVGKSGCGKSTLASLICGKHMEYDGSITIGKKEVKEIKEESLLSKITLIGHNSYLFKGTVRYNLQCALPNATDEQLWKVLEQVKLADFLKEEKGLDTELKEQGSNFSGGQRQRLALARAILRDTPIYIFDEAASNVDVESENDIMSLIIEMAKEKTVFLISHRLANVILADKICVLENGKITESGSHQELLEQHGSYEKMWNQQQQLEQYGKEA